MARPIPPSRCPTATSPSPTAPDPVAQDDAAPYWEATSEHRLVLPAAPRVAPTSGTRGFCPSCGSFDVDWVDVAGPRMITNIVGCDPDTVSIGDRVTVEFHDTASGHALARFRPIS